MEAFNLVCASACLKVVDIVGAVGQTILPELMNNVQWCAFIFLNCIYIRI